MKYHAPFGSTDADAPYVDRNTAAAIRGSVPPAAAIEDPQREIVDVISQSGFAPADLLQLAKAIQSQKMNFAEATGTANAIVVTLNPAPSSYSDIVGMPLIVLASLAPTGPATLRVAGLSVVGIVRRGGGALAGGEWSDGDLVAFSYDGEFFQLLDALPAEQTLVHVGTDTGSANAIVASVVPAVSEYKQGSVYSIKVANAVTGASTANFGAGVKSIARANGAPTRANDLVAGQDALLVYDGAKFQIANFSPANIPARNTQQFTASGSFTVPADVYRVKARVWGGGGGAGGSFGANGAGSGGGGAGYAEGIVEVTPGQVIAVTVGSGGAGGASTPTDGQNGGSSSFGGLISATGGGRGYAGNNALQTSQAGVGGTGSGPFSVSGASAGIGFLVGTTPAAGIGGSAGMGSGSPTISIGGVGAPGLFPGGGGNGGSAGSYAGAPGANGLVVIEY
ncbi:hypothetical protein LAC81_15010 [Ensifer adhaerens]|uniref:glycine-rich domain-containing protein n=1 Tax=Ensifer adhaerens TaxID=106592 RepID=UPI001CBDC9EF|nr:hypothetical protein [Ensifer adhaerens]MBZ7923099.1 hypothetical protein [Ensifer adhaerens]UAX91689.1 hypothetical protein LAC78_15005 [Ensifer adhaerens]UAX99317.1 hypothetical protein LAC80_15010 [Ensifer adhaerens]UAY06700.1 hypothetical protein LAC81_15010 [Ensifer adhaerens]